MIAVPSWIQEEGVGFLDAAVYPIKKTAAVGILGRCRVPIVSPGVGQDGLIALRRVAFCTISTAVYSAVVVLLQTSQTR